MTSSGGEKRRELFAKDEIERSLIVRLAHVVEIHAERIALRDGQRTLTYAELGASVTAVANAILWLRPDDSTPVALILDHGADMVIALLGVIATGRAYVPLDPSYPHAHLQQMLTHSGAGLVVSSEAHLALCRELQRRDCSPRLRQCAGSARGTLLRRLARLYPLHLGLDRHAERHRAHPPHAPAPHLEPRH